MVLSTLGPQLNSALVCTWPSSVQCLHYGLLSDIHRTYVHITCYARTHAHTHTHTHTHTHAHTALHCTALHITYCTRHTGARPNQLHMELPPSHRWHEPTQGYRCANKATACIKCGLQFVMLDSRRVWPAAPTVLRSDSKTHASVVWCYDPIAKHMRLWFGATICAIMICNVCSGDLLLLLLLFR